MITIRVPVPPSTAITNAIGVAGLLLIVVAIGALAGWPWATLAAGVIMAGLATLAQWGEQQPEPVKLAAVPGQGRPAA